MLSVLSLVAQPAISQHDGPHSNGDKKPSLKKMMRALDADGDGLISYGEFQLLDKRRGADRWDHADSDGDGNISRAEMETQLHAHLDAVTAKAEARFTETDMNNDGFVTPEERKQVAFEMLTQGTCHQQHLASWGRRRKGSEIEFRSTKCYLQI